MIATIKYSKNNKKRNIRLPVIEWSSRDGGVCAGVWWCDDVSPNPTPYNALKSSGVLLHFRLLWCVPTDEFLLLSKLLIEAADRKSCDNPKRRFSCDAIPIRRLSCNDDINFVSWWPLCCKLPCASAWSSSRPCCSPSRPPTKFGRSSSISFVCAAFATFEHDPDAATAAKFNWRLKIAGKILNCCWWCCWCGCCTLVDENAFVPSVDGLPSAKQGSLISNLPLLTVKFNVLSNDAAVEFSLLRALYSEKMALYRLSLSTLSAEKKTRLILFELALESIYRSNRSKFG